MGNTDSIPIVSQVKSLVQVIGGDENGALKTVREIHFIDIPAPLPTILTCMFMYHFQKSIPPFIYLTEKSRYMHKYKNHMALNFFYHYQNMQ